MTPEKFRDLMEKWATQLPHMFADEKQRKRNLESHRRWERISQARRTAARCAHCGQRLAAGAPVWLGPVSHHRATSEAPLCARCNGSPRVYYSSLPEYCAACGRAVYRRARRRRARVVVCCYKCRWSWQRQDQRRRQETRRRPCPVCGRDFVPPRSDARTCSPACRQKAYRRRVTARK
jgi:hypothetical protein